LARRLQSGPRRLLREQRGRTDGSRLHRTRGSALRILTRIDRSLRETLGREFVTAFYLIGGIVSLALLVYLFVALLKPEAF